MDQLSEINKLDNDINILAVERTRGAKGLYPMGNDIYTDQPYIETITEPDETSTIYYSGLYGYTRVTDTYDISDNGNWKNITDADIATFNRQMTNGGKYHHNFALPNHLFHFFDFWGRYVRRSYTDKNKMLWTYYKKNNKSYYNIPNPRPPPTTITKFRSVKTGKENVEGEPLCKVWSDDMQNTYGQIKQVGNNNYCRNPDNDIKGDWCYTDDLDVLNKKVYCYNEDNPYEMSINRFNAREARYGKLNEIFESIDSLNTEIPIRETKKNTLNITKSNIISDINTKNIELDNLKIEYDEQDDIKKGINIDIDNKNTEISNLNIITNDLNDKLSIQKNNTDLKYSELNNRISTLETLKNDIIDANETYVRLLNEEDRLTKENEILLNENTRLTNELNDLSDKVETKLKPVNDLGSSTVHLNVENFENNNDNNCINYKGCYRKEVQTNYIMGKYILIEIPYKKYRFKILKIEVFNSNNENISFNSSTSQSSIIKDSDPPYSTPCNKILGEISSNSYCAVNGDDINGAEMHPYDINEKGGPHWYLIDITKKYNNTLKSKTYPDKYYNISSIIIHYKNHFNGDNKPINYTLKILDENKNNIYQVNENDGDINIDRYIHTIKHNIFYNNVNNVINNLHSLSADNLTFDQCKNKTLSNGYAYFSLSDMNGDVGKCTYWHENWQNTLGKLNKIYKGECINSIFDKKSIPRNIGNDNEHAIYSINKNKCLESFDNNNSNNNYNNYKLILSISILILIIIIYIKYKSK